MINFSKYIKNYFFLAIALVSITLANAQEVRIIDNKGTINTINNNNVTQSDTAPTNPVENDVWYDSSGSTVVTKTYNGTNWISNAVNVYTGVFIITSSGITTVTGVPFQPSQVTFVAHANVETLNLNSDNGIGNNTRGINNSFGTMNGFARLNTDATIAQQVIFIGGSGHSINDISRFASNTNCIGLRYGNQDGNNLGVISGALTGFTTDGFTLNVSYTNGTVTDNNTDPILRVQPNDVQSEDVVVLFTAYK